MWTDRQKRAQDEAAFVLCCVPRHNYFDGNPWMEIDLTSSLQNLKTMLSEEFFRSSFSLSEKFVFFSQKKQFGKFPDVYSE